MLPLSLPLLLILTASLYNEAGATFLGCITFVVKCRLSTYLRFEIDDMS